MRKAKKDKHIRVKNAKGFKRQQKKQKEEVLFHDTGKTFSAKIPKRQADNFEQLIEDMGMTSNAEFVKFSLRMTYRIMKDELDGRKLFSEDDDENRTEYKFIY